MAFLALSVLVAVSVVPFWDEIIVSGAHVWVIGSASVSVNFRVDTLSLVGFLLLPM